MQKGKADASAKFSGFSYGFVVVSNSRCGNRPRRSIASLPSSRIASGPVILGCGSVLRDLGYVEGKSIHFEPRFAHGQVDRLPGLAADLVNLKVDVIVAVANTAAFAAKAATLTIPIVLGQLMGLSYPDWWQACGGPAAISPGRSV